MFFSKKKNGWNIYATIDYEEMGFSLTVEYAALKACIL